ncbi:ABC transporter ATP-binding protein [Flavobacterium bizetiae]|uniref:ABC transporter ATP-binding protein n=1 Tax=Flavobacterium bizetiae TaxID=2704140 RepID=UPI003757A2D0
MKKDIILKAENISKQYRLGQVGTGTLSHDINRWWHKVRGKENPYLKIGETNDRATKGNSDYVWALQDINFEVERGEVLGIIGKNGAGKSTLLKILSKVTAPTTGTIKSRGRIASLLEVGTGFNGEMTGRENIFLNGAILGMTKKEISSKLDEIIEFSGCERYIDTPVKRYSSGMTVRLAFAVAAFLEPEILVIDEVLAVGDAEFQKKAIGKMQDISKGEGRTVLFVSHNMAAVKSLCTRGILLENGNVKLIGSIDEVMSQYSINEDVYSKVLISQNNSHKIKPQLKFIHIDKNEIFNNNLILTAEFISSIDINNPSLGIVVFNHLNTPVFGTNSRIHNNGYLDKKCREGKIKLTIRNLPLLPGHYFISVYFGDSISDFERYEEVLKFELKDFTNVAPNMPEIKHIGSIRIENAEWNIYS